MFSHSLYIHVLTPPPIHPSFLFVSSGSWEVANLGCNNIIGRDTMSTKLPKLNSDGPIWRPRF